MGGRGAGGGGKGGGGGVAANAAELERADDLRYRIQFQRTQLRRKSKADMDRKFLQSSISRDISQLNSLKRSLAKKGIVVKPIPATGPKL